jgi:hypothetical protein
MARFLTRSLLGLLIVAGYASAFLGLGLISILSVMPAGIALGLLISSDSLNKGDVLRLRVGGLLGCVLVLVYVYWFGHHWVSPKPEVLGVIIFFGVGPIISGLRVFLRRKRKVT